MSCMYEVNMKHYRISHRVQGGIFQYKTIVRNCFTVNFL